MKAGFGKFDVTPRVGVELYGFGPYQNRKSIGIRDILEARAGAFTAGDHTAVIITCDLVKIEADTAAVIRSLLCARYPELKAKDIMIQASHTHSGPSTSANGGNGWGQTDPAWRFMLPYKMVEAAYQAMENRVEAEVSQTLTKCEHIGLNRVYDEDGPPLERVLKEDWTPEKPELTDTVCRVIRFDSASDKKLLGFMAYFGCHPVVCCDDNKFIHGDFPGVAMHTLMREFPGSVGLFLQGALGDVNTGCVYRKQQESLLALDVFAARFSNAVRSGLEQAEPLKIDAIETVSAVFPFAVKQTFTPEIIAHFREKFAAQLFRADADDSARETLRAAVKMIGLDQIEKLMDEKISCYMMEMQIVKMGDLEFIGTPFEVMQAIKNEAHAASSAKYPMLMSLTNDSGNYAPDNESLKEKEDASVYAKYSALDSPMYSGRLPYADIHNEIVRYMKELERRIAEE